ncbi:MAG: hypothetical protein ACLPQS_17605 [Acidimicrobiales bacterium]
MTNDRFPGILRRIFWEKNSIETVLSDRAVGRARTLPPWVTDRTM